MSDYEHTIELVETAQNSAGRSSQQFAKYADSVEYSVKRLSNTWEQFRVNLANNDFYKDLIDTLNTFLEKISNFDSSDWVKFGLGFFVLGKSAVHNFLEGSQKALSEIAPTFKKNFETLQIKAKNGITNTNLFQRMALGYKPKTAEDFSAQVENNRQSYLQLQNDKYQKEVLNPILDKLEKAQDKYNKAYNNLNKGKNRQKAEEAIAEIKAQEKAYKDAKEAQSAYMQEKEDWYNEHDYTSPKVLADEYNRQHQLTEAQAAMKAEAFKAIGQSAAAAFTAAFTASMLTDDPGEIFKTSLVSGATAAIPGVIETVITGIQDNEEDIAEAFAGGFQAGVAALAASLAIAAIAATIKWSSNEIKEYNEEVLKSTNAYYNLTKQAEQLVEKEEELGKKAYTSSAAAEKSRTAYQDLSSAATSLQKLQNKTILTTEESEELVSVSNELAEIAPELVSHYDNEGNAVIRLGSAYDDLIAKKKEQMLIDEAQAALDAKKLAENKVGQAVVARYQAEELYNQAQTDDSLKSLSGKMARQLAKDTGGFIGVGQLGADLFGYNIYGESSAEQEYKGSFYKEALKDIPEFSSMVGIENNIKAYEEFNRIIDKSPELWDKVDKAIEKVSNNYELLNYQINLAIDSYIESSKDLAAARLGQDSKLYNEQTNRNVQSLMQDYVLNKNGISREQLEKQFEPIAEEKGLIKGTYDYNEQFYAYIKELFENIKIDDTELEKVFNASVISVLSQLDDLELDLPDLIEYMKKYLGAAFPAWLDTQSTEIAAYNKNIEEIQKALTGTKYAFETTEDQETELKTTANEYAKSVLSSRYIDDYIEKLNQYANIDRTEDFLDMFEDLKPEDIAKIFDIKWDKVAASEYNEQLDALAKATGQNRDKIKAIVDGLHLFDFISTNEDEFKEKVNGYQAYDKFDKKISAIKSAADSWAKDGVVSNSAIEAMYDAGLNLADLVDENLQFNIDEAERIIKEQLQNEMTSLEIEKEKTQEYKDQLLLIQAQYGTGVYSKGDLSKLDPQLVAELFTENNGKYTLNNTYVNSQIKAQDEILENYDRDTAALVARIKALWMEINSVVSNSTKDQADKQKEAADKIAKAQKAVEDAYEDVLEKQQAVIDKQEELNKVLYGDENHKNKLDELYNYNTAIETIEDSISDAKEALDDLDGKDPTEFLDAWISGTHQKAANVQAANDRYAAAIDSINSMLTNRLTDYLASLGRGVSTNVSDYYNYNPELDRYEVNYQQLNAAQMNDDLKDFIEEQIDLMNQHKKAIKKNQDDLKKLEKEFEDYQKKIRDDYISVQESIAKTLEEFYKKEIEDKKEMYDALKEADDKYLDALEKAIEKERKLRDRQDKWNSLATKEKKLSLLQRDTSGANQKQVQSLQKEIEKERQSILDNAVDTIVDNLKELYEEQQETREIELEYQEVLQENTDYIAEANSLLQSWKTVDEMREWMWGHTKDIDKMSDQAVEKLTEDWADMFDTIQTYNAMTAMEFSDAFDVSGQEVQRIVLDTSETLTSEADRAFGEITTQVNTAIESAEKAVSEALKALADAQTTYNEKIAELNKLINELGGSIEGIDYNPSPSSPQSTASMADKVAWAKENRVEVEDEPDMATLVSERKEQMAKKTVLDFYPRFFDWIEEESWENGGKGYLRMQSTPEVISALKILGYSIAEVPEGDEYFHYVFKNSDMLNRFMSGLGERRKNIRIFKKGGLANYTGPAWVDGTPSRPEAFLNAEDTARIGEAANIFASVASLSTNGSLSSGLSQSIGDTNVQLNIHVDSIATPEQVDYLIDRVKEEFVNIANPIGTAVILHQ